MVESFEELEEEIKDCKRCKLCNNRNHIVLGSGNKNAKIMFIGEGPGADEDAQGEPFVGKAGKLMNQAFIGLGIERNNVYIANIVKCRPPMNRNPEPDEIISCIGYLHEQIALVKPEIIVLLGSIALKAICGNEFSITKCRGKWFEKNGIWFLPTFHPAALLRDEGKKILFWNDLKSISSKIH